MKILFQGDSITDAFRKPEEINPAHQLGSGYVLLVASRLAFAYPEMSLEFLNRGISGDCIDDLDARWQEDAVDLRPDLLSLFVGVNHVVRFMKYGVPLCTSAFDQTYRQLIERLQAENGSLHVVLLEPFVLEVGDVSPEWRTWLEAYQKVTRKIAEEFQFRFLALQERFDDALDVAPAAYWAYDGIHPTHAGFELIANAWIEGTKDLFGENEPMLVLNGRNDVASLSSRREHKSG